MGNRIAVMKDGKLQQVGTPLEVYETPSNLFVANFIGTPPMNFVRGELTENGTVFSAPKFKLPVPQAIRAAAAKFNNQKVILGVRPEHLLDAADKVRGESAQLTTDVEIVEPLGDLVVVHGRLGDDMLVFKMDPHRSPAFGAKVPVWAQLDSLHLFDASTEKRIA